MSIKKSESKGGGKSSGKTNGSQSQFMLMIRRYCRNRMAVVSFFFILLLILGAIFADSITPYDYAVQNLSEAFQLPSRTHLMGTDNFGRDMFTRILRGARVSLFVSVLAVAISTVAAIILGGIAGYYGGAVDAVIMRIIDIFIAIPSLMLSMVVSAALGTGLVKTAIALAIANIGPTARQLRSSVLTMKGSEYVEASRAFGANDFHILVQHVIPNCLAPIIIQIAMGLGGMIMCISSLSFLGLGVQPPTPEWGNMVAASQQYLRTYPHLILFPGLAVMLTMLAFNLIGDGIRDALDPHMKR